MSGDHTAPGTPMDSVKQILDNYRREIDLVGNSTWNSSSLSEQGRFVVSEFENISKMGNRSLHYYHNITASFYGEYQMGANLTKLFPEPPISNLTTNGTNTTTLTERRGAFPWDSPGSYTFSVFSNQTLIHPDVDFVHASLRLVPDDRSVFATDYFVSGFGIHIISTGKIFLYLIPGYRGYDFKKLLEFLPASVFDQGKEAVVTQLENRVARLEQQLKNNPYAMEPVSAAEPVSPCNFRIMAQLQPVDTPLVDLLKYEAEIRDQNGARVLSKPPPLSLKFVWHSEACNAMMVAKGTPSRGLLLERYFLKLNQFVGFAIIVTIFDLAFLMRQTGFTTTPSRSLRVSVHSIGMHAVLDAYLCILALTSSMVLGRAYLQFVALAFLRFVLFAIFELRYVLTLSRIQDFDTNQVGSRLFFLLLVCLMIVSQSARSSRLVVGFAFVTFSIWLPQIAWNAWKSLRNGLSWSYLIGSSVCKLSLAWFIFGWPDNAIAFSLGRTYHRELVIVSVYVFVQIAIVMLQDVLGPRFFLPNMFKDTYDYHRILTVDEETAMGDGTAECAICFSEVDLSTENHDSLLSDVLHMRRRNVMVTPCSHIFHTECLSHWMDQSLVCPICRAPLPAR